MYMQKQLLLDVDQHCVVNYVNWIKQVRCRHSDDLMSINIAQGLRFKCLFNNDANMIQTQRRLDVSQHCNVDNIDKNRALDTP